MWPAPMTKTRLNSAQGTMLDAYLVGQLSAQLAATAAPSAVGTGR